MRDEEVLQWFEELARRGAGPYGVAVACVSGLVRVTTSCGEALRQIVEWLKVPSGGEPTATVEKRLALSSHPFTKVIVDTIRGHTQVHGEGAWQMLHTTTRVLLELYRVRAEIPPSLVHLGSSLCKEWVHEVADGGGLVARIDAMNARHLVAIAAATLASNSLLALSAREAAWLASRLTRLFLGALDPETEALDRNCMRFALVTAPSAQVMDSDLKDGVLVDWPLPYEARIAGLTRVSGRIVLYDMCLEPEDITVHGNTDPVCCNEAALADVMKVLQRAEAAGVRVLGSQKTIHQTARLWCARRGILALERLSIRHIDAVRCATGCTVLTTAAPDALTPRVLGHVEELHEVVIGGKRCILLRGPRQVQTLVLTHCHSQFLDELQLSLNRAATALVGTMRDTQVCPGGGVTEAVLAAYVREKIALLEQCDATVGIAGHLRGEMLHGALAVARAFAKANEEWAGLVAGGKDAGAKVRDANLWVGLRDLAAATLGIDPLAALRAAASRPVHGPSPPPNASFPHLRTVLPIPHHTQNPPRTYRPPGLRAFRGVHALSYRSTLNSLTTLVTFTSNGELATDASDHLLPVLDAYPAKLKGIASALDVASLLFRTDTFIVDTN